MSPLVTLLLGIVLILALIVANAYFVAQEFAYMSVDRSRLRALAADGDEAAGRALAVTRRTSFMLSGAQLGITVTGLLIGELAEPIIGGSLAEMIGAAGATAAIAAGTLLVATVIQMIFAELYPKNLAIAAPEPLARALARSTQVYLFLFGWLIAFFDWSSNALLRLVGVTPVEDVDSTADSKDLGRIVADSRASGDLPPDLSMLIDRILDFPEHTVEHAMVPRAKLGEMDPTTTVAEARERMAGGHTRYPVMGHVEDETTHEEEERLYGVLHLDDILDPDLPPETPVGQLVREPVVLPEVMPLPDAVVELSESDNRLACVVDEYGGVPVSSPSRTLPRNSSANSLTSTMPKNTTSAMRPVSVLITTSGASQAMSTSTRWPASWTSGCRSESTRPSPVSSSRSSARCRTWGRLSGSSCRTIPARSSSIVTGGGCSSPRWSNSATMCQLNCWSVWR